MRPRAALAVISSAAVLGTLAGAYVLPEHSGTAGAQPSVSPSAPPSVSPSAPPTSPSLSPSPSASPSATLSEGGPVISANLLTVVDFRTVGLDVAPRRSDVRLEVVVCEERQTLDDIAVSGPPLQQLWEKGSVVASEQLVAARDNDEAKDVARRVLRKLEGCQHEVAGHWVYGPTRTENLGPATTASWLGLVSGELNTSGHAPSGEKINGGIAVLRHGSHVAVFNIGWCASAGDSPACVTAPDGSDEQLAALSRTAAKRLG